MRDFGEEKSINAKGPRQGLRFRFGKVQLRFIILSGTRKHLLAINFPGNAERDRPEMTCSRLARAWWVTAERVYRDIKSREVHIYLLEGQGLVSSARSR